MLRAMAPVHAFYSHCPPHASGIPAPPPRELIRRSAPLDEASVLGELWRVRPLPEPIVDSKRTSGTPRYKFSLSPRRFGPGKGGIMLTITKAFSFHAAHRLCLPGRSDAENHRIYGVCSTLHGHTYTLQVTLGGTPDESGMILHFDTLKALVRREVLDRYDHANLNELAEYHDVPVTAENMAMYIFRVLDEALAQHTCHLQQITVYETPTAWATCSRHD